MRVDKKKDDPASSLLFPSFRIPVPTAGRSVPSYLLPSSITAMLLRLHVHEKTMSRDSSIIVALDSKFSTVFSQRTKYVAMLLIPNPSLVDFFVTPHA
jgi:hypothetical protein